MGLFVFSLLTIPFIPNNLLASFSSFLNIESRLNTLGFEGTTATNAATAVNEIPGLAGGLGWLQDFAVPADRTAPGYVLTFLTGVWIIGIISFLVIMLVSNRNLWLIKESIKPIENKEILALFSKCKAEIGIRQNILLGSSFMVKTPMTMGLFKTVIILPAEEISFNDVRYAMLHELAHCKNKDIQINCIMFIYQALYWFNPLVHLIFAQMRLERELACDAFVLNMLPCESHISYGETLLNFVSKLSHPPALYLGLEMGGFKSQIIKRVKHITSYTADSGLLKAKSVCAFALIGLLVFFQISLVSVLARNSENRFYFTADNVQHMNLDYFFGDFEGSFVLYDLDTSLYTIHNINMSETRVSPFSTYKIFSALIALETGVLDANYALREWDGTTHLFESWNRDHNLISAMQYSVSWYFNDMDVQVGISGLQYYLTRLSYGNRNLTGGITDFWNGSSLLISPLEQVKLLTSLHQDEYLFEVRHVDTVMDVLRLSERAGAVLSGKTGSGAVNGRITNGWFVGYVENGGSTFVFATYIQGEDNAGGSTAAEITLSILEDIGIF